MYSGDASVFLFEATNTLAIMLIVLYSVDMLRDLEVYYIDLHKSCKKLNTMFNIRAFYHLFVAILLCFTDYGFLFILNLPMLLWLWIDLDENIYDPTDIMNPGKISEHLWQCGIHLVFYMVFLAVYTYYLITAKYFSEIIVYKLDHSEVVFRSSSI